MPLQSSFVSQCRIFFSRIRHYNLLCFTVDEEASDFFICMFKDVLSCLADFIRVMFLALYIPNVAIQ